MSNSVEDLYELQWNNHAKVLKRTFDTFRNDNELVDVTLSCEGRKLKAHKIVLSACSLYFLDLFRDNPCQHPIVILRDIKYQAMADILSFMYIGEVNVAMEHLNIFLQTAEYLKVKGLSEELPHMSTLLESSTLNDTQPESKTPANPVVKVAKKMVQPLEKILDLKKIPTALEENYNEQKTVSTIKAENTEIADLSESESIEFMEMNQNVSENHNYNELISNPEYNANFSLLEDIEGTSQNKTFPCPHCNKVFTHQVSLKLHLPQHAGRTSCALCHAVLSRKYELKIHMRRRHNIDMDLLHAT